LKQLFKPKCLKENKIICFTWTVRKCRWWWRTSTCGYRRGDNVEAPPLNSSCADLNWLCQLSWTCCPTDNNDRAWNRILCKRNTLNKKSKTLN